MDPARTAGVPALVDRLFRDEAGRLTALLTRLLGPAQLALAEDVVQEAFLAAMRTWSRGAVPANPGAWLLQVARRKAIDALRRDRTLDAHAPAIAAELAALEPADPLDTVPADPHGDAPADAFADDRLRMILLCCHPAVSPDSRVALTLKAAGGFGVGEIARAFVADERAVAQRLVRAKRALREAGATFDLPTGDALTDRLDAVHDVLYLMFNEGHTAHAGDALLRRDVADEALRMTERLLRDPRTASPTAHALAALFCFQAARFDARTDAGGDAILLATQDRTRWDAAHIARGFAHLDRASHGDRITPYHVEAEIASRHAAARTWEATDWPSIVQAYDRLLALRPSPVVALNRIVALRHAQGAAAAWDALSALAHDPAVARYPLTPAIRATLLTDLGRPAEAQAAWREARAVAGSAPMQRLTDQRLAELEARPGAPHVDSAPRHPS